jgi:hypothetical protein
MPGPRKEKTGPRIGAPSATTPTGKRRYSDADKAAALLYLKANGGNYKRTAEELGIPLMTLHGWGDGRCIHPEVTRIRDGVATPLQERLDEQVDLVLGDLAEPGRRGHASLLEVAKVFEIVFEKRQALAAEEPDGA